MEDSLQLDEPEEGPKSGPETHRLLRQSEEVSAQLQSMEAMGRLAGGIAHVFNNLLTAISCETELALLRLQPDEPARKHLREVERVGERGAALARQLLAFSGRQVMQPKLLQLNSVLTNLDDKLRRVLGDNIEFRMELDPDLDRVKIDPTQMEQVILNLISNARDVLPQGGMVKVETKMIEVRPGMDHPLRFSPGRYVQLKVTDTGPGMTEEVRRRVFEPFFTTKQGTPEISGLGLSTTYGIVLQSGGRIIADSDPGQGSRFTVFLPSAEAVDESENGDGISRKRPWETILLVEDEENVRRPLLEILSAHGYNVLEAADAAQALEISKKHSGPIHLMVTDILMGSMSGVELAEQLSYDRAGMKVLFATGYPAGLAEVPSLSQVDAPLLKKPFSGRDLSAKIREVLEGD
jgi:nitrogen-specific signal transduction histidine kinase/CheY-like chemotaxis protein